MPPHFARELLHPLPLSAAGLLALNDHVLKGSGLLPGAVTGKLSDFAGLFVFPVLLFVTLDALTLGRASRPGWRTPLVVLSSLLTALVFSAVKLVPQVNAWLSSVIGPMLLDPSDLIALPSCALAALWLSRRAESSGGARRLFRALVFMAVALACLATSAPRLVRNYPVWEIQSLGARKLDCAVVDLWVSKSGKQGFGVTLELAASGSCQVKVTSARFTAAGQTYAAAQLPEPQEITGKRHVYLPFAFDNQTLWNEGVRDGELELVLDAGRSRERLVLRMHHAWQGPHRMRVHGPPSAPPSSSSPLQLGEPVVPLEPADAAAPPSTPGFAEPPPEPGQ